MKTRKDPTISFHIRYKIAAISILLQVIITTHGFGQEYLKLPAPTWKIEPVRYRIATITDDRSNKSIVGCVSASGKRTDLKFESSLQEVLWEHLSIGLSGDTSHTAPLHLHIVKFNLQDQVNGSKHKISLDQQYNIYRSLDGKEQKLFEFPYRVSLDASGNRPLGILEKLVTQSLEALMKQFNDWADENPGQVYFMNHLQIHLTGDDTFANRSQGDTILWSKDYRLSWKDFKGKDASNSPFSAQSNCIYTLKTIPSFSNDTMHITILLHPCFTRGASWVHLDALQDSLLMHEQLHFDLCELFGRKFREKLDRANFSFLEYGGEINELFNQHWTEYRNSQNQYDEETQHGIIRDQQNAWMEQVRKELNELARYGVE